MCQLQHGTIRQCDGDWVVVNVFVDDMCAVGDEVAGGTRVAKVSGGVDAVPW